MTKNEFKISYEDAVIECSQEKDKKFYKLERWWEIFFIPGFFKLQEIENSVVLRWI